MAHFRKHVLIMAAATTMLGGCSLVGSVADTAWSGTKTVAKWVSAPVRYVLRSSPEQDTQFAGAAVKTEDSAATETVETVMLADAGKTAAEPFDATVAPVETVAVTAFEPISHTSETQISSRTSQSSVTTRSYAASTVSTQTSTQSGNVQTASWEGPIRYSVETSARGDQVHFTRLKGQTSMSDWMDCDRSADGYWLTAYAGGRINPAFEVCMRRLDYVLETERASYETAELAVEPAPTPKPVVKTDAMPALVGASEKPKLRSSYVPTQEPQSDLPHKF